MLIQALAEAVKSTNVMEAQQVIKGENGDEIILPFNQKPQGDLITYHVITFQNSVSIETDLPEYLDEDPSDSPGKDDHAVARHNTGGNTGRFGNSWFGSIVNAVNKNLYW